MNNLAPTIPDELATRLNVLQGQIHRELRVNMSLRLPISTTLQQWAAELRDIELRLRDIPVVVPCPLCGQHITDGKPCGCGARPVVEAADPQSLLDAYYRDLSLINPESKL